MTLDRLEQRCGRIRAADQGRSIRQHDRIVPWALNDERQIKLIRRDTGNQRRRTFKVEVAARYRRLTGQVQLYRGAVHAQIFDHHPALVDLDVERETIKWRAPRAKIAVTRERTL